MLKAGEPSLGFRPHTSQENPQPLKYPFRTSAATHGSPASPLMPPLHSLPAGVKWFLLSVLGCKAFHQLMFSWFLRMLSLHLRVIPDWFWEEVSVASTYSSTFLDLYIMFSLQHLVISINIVALTKQKPHCWLLMSLAACSYGDQDGPTVPGHPCHKVAWF